MDLALKILNFWKTADNGLQERLCLCLLAALTAVAYANALLNGFTMDDVRLYIVHNPQVIHPTFRGLFLPNQISRVFRPLTFATFALDWNLGGGVPLGFHAINVVLHAVVSCLVFLSIRVLLEGVQYRQRIAFVAALLFAIHPIHTEAVSSIVGRAELLAAGFLILGWIFHLQDRPVAAVICFALALLSKESAAVFLPLVLIGDYARNKWKPKLRYGWMAGVTAAFVLVLWKVQGNRLGPANISIMDNPLIGLPFGPRVLNAVRVAWKYVGLQVYPGTLSADYSYNQIPLYAAWKYLLPAALATIVTVAVWIWAIKNRKGALVLALGIYVVSFAITANIIMPIGTIMAERLAYLPSVGFCLLVALGWNWLRERQRTLALALLIVVVVALGIRTIERNRNWESNRTLYMAQLRAAPDSAKTHQNMALLYMDDRRLDLAQQELETALRIFPPNPTALATYGLLETWRGNYHAAGAKLEEAFYLIEPNDPAYDEIAVDLATVYGQTGHVDAALDLLNREIQKSPSYDAAWAKRAVIHYRQGDIVAARNDAEAALRLNPKGDEARKVMQALNAGQQAPSSTVN